MVEPEISLLVYAGRRRHSHWPAIRLYHGSRHRILDLYSIANHNLSHQVDEQKTSACDVVYSYLGILSQMKRS